MKIGIIGAGGIASAFAKQALRAGHEVILSNSRGPDSLSDVISGLGTGATAGTRPEAAAAEMVFVAVPWSKIPAALSDLPVWNGKIVIDANNPIEAPDFKPADLNGSSSTEVFSKLAPGARVVKAFNTLPVPVLRSDPNEAGGHRVIFISGDDTEAKKIVGTLIESMGFAAIDLGNIESGGRMQQFPTGPLPALNLLKLG